MIAYSNKYGRIWERVLRVLNFGITDRKRKKGGTRLRWIDNINEDITSLGLMLRGAMDLTIDRGQLKSSICTHRRQTAFSVNFRMK